MDEDDLPTSEEIYDTEPRNYEVPKETMTCFHCDDRGTCKYAWDLYNQDGDCLAEK